MDSLSARFRPGRKSKNSNDGHDGSQGAQVAHTLTACCRCRHRKTRCDPSLPRCGPCERSNEVCEYFDSTKGQRISRKYVVHLENMVRKLEQELAQNFQESDTPPDAEILVRGAGLVRFTDNDESRFLGPSSGIAMARLVMELAKQSSSTKNIMEIVPETKARRIKDWSAQETSKPTSKVYPLISHVAAPDLPSRDLTKRLVDMFNKKAQYLFPTLHEPTFRRDVEEVYAGSKDAYKNFILRMAIAISMQKLESRWAGLADSYYLAALPFLEDAMRPMNLGTLQCFALIAQYSMVTPTRTASFWVVGLATRLCQELGITDEATITRSETGAPLDVLEIDMRRRLFWITTSFEFGLAHSLGRPSAYAVTHDHINLKYFLPVEDDRITPSGVLPGSTTSMKKLIAIHFIKMRLLQLEIRRKLYMKKRSYPNNDQDPWFAQMEAKLHNWVSSSPKHDEGTGLNETWFKVRNNTMIVFLYRPSPQVPEPSIRAASLCFEAAIFNIYVQREQIAVKSVDLSWIFTQTLFMALNTMLWALSYPDIRKGHPKDAVERHLRTAEESIHLASERWPGVEAALELYDTLIDACLKAYDGKSDTSYVVGSPSNKPGTISLPDVATPPPLSTPSTVYSELSSSHNGQETDQVSPFSSALSHLRPAPVQNNSAQKQIVFLEPTNQMRSASDAFTHSLYPTASSYQESAFNPSAYTNPLPPTPTFNFGPSALHGADLFQFPGQDFPLDGFNDPYSQYLQAQYTPLEPLASLDSAQQSDLMDLLERNAQTGAFDSGPPTTYMDSSGLLWMA